MPPSSTLGNFGTIIISKLFINPIHIQTIRALCEFVWYDLRNYVRFRYEGFVSSVISGPNETILTPPPPIPPNPWGLSWPISKGDFSVRL